MAIQKKSLISALKTAKTPKAASATPEAVTGSNKKSPVRAFAKSMARNFVRFAKIVE